MSILIFENPGEIDPRLISAFGVNVKPTDSAIGFFGTGLKYALAGLMRLGQAVTIQSGETVYTIGKVKESLRGKDFEFVRMSWYDNLAGPKTQVLGFTTELGKTWEPWMFYRELQCNATDEGGAIAHRTSAIPHPTAGLTRVIVEGHALTPVHNDRSLFFLDGEPVARHAQIALFPGTTTLIYNKGVAVGKLPQPALFRYNLEYKTSLTEDRTLKDMWNARNQIAQAICGLSDRPLLLQILLAEPDTFESKLDFDNYLVPDNVFLDLVEELSRTKLAQINPSARLALARHRKAAFAPDLLSLSRVQTGALQRAKAFIDRLGYDLSPYPIICVKSLGERIMGLAKDEKIYISTLAFDKGTKQVAATLLEEFFHLAHGVDDYSHEMQDLLFDKLISLGEELQGAPL